MNDLRWREIRTANESQSSRFRLRLFQRNPGSGVTMMKVYARGSSVSARQILS